MDFCAVLCVVAFLLHALYGEKLGEVLRYVSAYKQPARGALAAFDLVYERLADLVCDASKQWPPEKVTRALDEMANNANILEERLMRFAR